MGKNLIQQRRGRAKGRYHVPAHKFRGEIKYKAKGNWEGTIKKIIHDPGRTAPIAKVLLTNHSSMNILANEGMCTGTSVKSTDNKSECTPGNIIEIGHVPEGYPIFNIEIRSGDGGKLVRAGGSSASIVSHTGSRTVIRLPSGQFKTLDSSCRATIGIPAGGGRREKPFMKAGKKFHAHRKKGKQYPKVRGVAMCAVNHPHGGGSHQHVGGPSSVPRGAPPGRKVGNIAPKRTGKR
jgi:large subunit ribosomal protein L2